MRVEQRPNQAMAAARVPDKRAKRIQVSE
jgi:hypothetical protein